MFRLIQTNSPIEQILSVRRWPSRLARLCCLLAAMLTTIFCSFSGGRATPTALPPQELTSTSAPIVIPSSQTPTRTPAPTTIPSTQKPTGSSTSVASTKQLPTRTSVPTVIPSTQAPPRAAAPAATPDERAALVALYQATGGDKWARKDGWLSDQPICSWYGVVCSSDHIVELQLETNGLQGKIPPEIGLLTNLQVLSLSEHGHEGLKPPNRILELPPEIDRLTNLQTLYLYGNRLTALPPEIGKLASLRELDLGYNLIPVNETISRIAS